jgi:hypothetical protein
LFAIAALGAYLEERLKAVVGGGTTPLLVSTHCTVVNHDVVVAITPECSRLHEPAASTGTITGSLAIDMQTPEALRAVIAGSLLRRLYIGTAMPTGETVIGGVFIQHNCPKVKGKTE